MHRRTAVVCGLALALSLTAQNAARANVITADGTSCTLANAIRAANTDAPAGGCPAGAGADVVRLTLDVSLDFADASGSGSSTIDGARAGLPDVTTAITVQAEVPGDLIERDAALGCEPPENGPNDAFRIFNVVGPGAQLTLDGVTVRNGCVAPAGTVARGGGILVAGGTLTLSAATLSGNVARAQLDTESPAEGGGVYGDTASSVAIVGSAFTGNIARGAIGVTAQPQSTLGGNGLGGGLATLGTLTVSGSQFTGNRALGGDAVSSGGHANGGAIFLAAGASAALDTSTFTANEAIGGPATGGNGGSGGAGTGGAIDMDNQATLTGISRSSFEGNRAEGGLQGGFGGGGGLALSGVVGVLDRLLVRENAAVGGNGNAAGNSSGGGMRYGGTSFVALRDSWFDSNSTIGGTGTLLGGDGSGGGVSLIRDVGEITGVTFSNNVARGSAGSAEFSGRAEGGALFNIFGTIDVLANCTFHGNLAQGGGTAPATGGQASGGAIYNAGDLLGVSHVTILGNVASGVGDDAFGGGIYLEDSGSISIDNSILSNNAVANTGDGSAFGADCFSEGTFSSAGSNHIKDSVPTCTFASAGDVQDVDPLMGPFGDHGCAPGRALPDGSCAPTDGLLVTSLVVDSGSCALSGLADDERGFARPVDIAEVPNAADACDKGAFELRAGELEVDLSIAKAPPAENPQVGENAVFVLTATNESTLLPATGVFVTDFMPAGLSFVGSDCGATELGGSVTWNIGGMPPNTSQACTLTFLRLDAAAIYNTAQVTGNETDTNTSNDLDGAELASVQSIVEIPTLDHLGVVLLALGLVAAALVRLKR